MSEYQPLVVPECIDFDFLQDLYGNIDCIFQCAQQERKEFTCTPFAITFTGELNDGVLNCQTIIPADPIIDANQSNDASEQKMVMFTSSEVVSYNPGGGDSGTGVVSNERFRYTLQCVPEGQDTPTQAKSTPSGEYNDGCIKNLCLDCAPSDELQLCVRANGTLAGNVASTNYRVTVCGAVICIKDNSGDEIEGYFKPPRLDPECKYGRDALYLALQNYSALQNKFRFTSQQSECNQYEFNDTAPHAIYTATGIADYLIVGRIRVCVTSDRFSATTFVVTPQVGCDGRVNNCIGQSKNVPGRDSGQPSVSVCLDFRFVTCGRCTAGQTLFVGMSGIDDCTTDPDQGVLGSITIDSVEQSYCVYTFERDEIAYNPTPATISPCPKRSEIQPVLENLDQINEVCINDRPVELNHVELENQQFPAFDSNPYSFVLKPAEPWTQTPEELFPPIKKWNGVIEVCAIPVRGLGGNPIYANLQIELLCGGTVIDAKAAGQTVVQYGSEDTDQVFNYSTFCVKCDHECFLCPINQDITLNITGGMYQNAPPDQGGFRSYIDIAIQQVKLFCF